MPAVSSLPDYMSPILRILPPEPLFRDFSSIRARAILRPERPDIPGTGYSPTGMTSSYPFVSGDVVLGANGNGTGDVAFGASEDGNAVQAYMLTTDNGILAYEITRYDI